jgi:hypothetical protein
MRPRHFRQDARFLCAISDRFEGCERLTVQIERVDEVVTARRELGESTEGDAGSFVVAEPPLNRKCVLGLLRCGLGVSLESVDDPVEARGEASAQAKPSARLVSAPSRAHFDASSRSDPSRPIARHVAAMQTSRAGPSPAAP